VPGAAEGAFESRSAQRPLNMRVRIRQATASDLPRAIELLSVADLPTDDLAPAHLALIAEGDAGTLGVIGLERFGDVALLRSLVVSPLARGAGVGRALVKMLESSARELGVQELWLLTIDADGFFLNLGFNKRERGNAPDAIRDSAEFSSLCPDDAVLMSRAIAIP